MDRAQRIIECETFRNHLQANLAAERGRMFCRHDLAHFLDVARIAVIMAGEEKIQIQRELLYAAALLHDIGRHRQYEQGTPHEQASAEIAGVILNQCGFTEKETGVITDAIRSHRDPSAAGESSLRGLLYRADKASRLCFACEARDACNWKEERKNRELLY